MIDRPYTNSALNALTILKVLHREIKAAGIPKQDSRGDAVDLHSLRVTFALMLAAGGAPLATARLLLRRPAPALTARRRVDPAILDTAGAVESLAAARTF